MSEESISMFGYSIKANFHVEAVHFYVDKADFHVASLNQSSGIELSFHKARSWKLFSHLGLHTFIRYCNLCYSNRNILRKSDIR